MSFKELKIGEVFCFASEFDTRFSGLAKGPWKKISPRQYERLSDGMVCNVGSINVSVVSGYGEYGRY